MNNIYDFNLYKYKHNEEGNIVLEVFDPREIKICGRNIEQIIQILNGLDLEKEHNMTLTMENLGKWCELIKKDIEKQQRQAIEDYMKNIELGSDNNE